MIIAKANIPEETFEIYKKIWLFDGNLRLRETFIQEKYNFPYGTGCSMKKTSMYAPSKCQLLIRQLQLFKSIETVAKSTKNKSLMHSRKSLQKYVALNLGCIARTKCCSPNRAHDTLRENFKNFVLKTQMIIGTLMTSWYNTLLYNYVMEKKLASALNKLNYIKKDTTICTIHQKPYTIKTIGVSMLNFNWQYAILTANTATLTERLNTPNNPTVVRRERINTNILILCLAYNKKLVVLILVDKIEREEFVRFTIVRVIDDKSNISGGSMMRILFKQRSYSLRLFDSSKMSSVQFSNWLSTENR
ncbi:hypothetical protein Bhyg_06087 [Pseudolycoriella hygida]|uniref:Uncharacterized protein n=1 Tax=Pseudolycoriella hygida TaxID=35572 RepID=A0A9Q0MZZ2_9DIPT|nr:hypothetical protein Bhyg_06087 [Pseudolycoriella hygida]